LLKKKGSERGVKKEAREKSETGREKYKRISFPFSKEERRRQMMGFMLGLLKGEKETRIYQ
jgi:hypothetical protein